MQFDTTPTQSPINHKMANENGEIPFFKKKKKDRAPVVQKLHISIAIHWLNLYPLDSAIGFPNTYPLDSDLSGG